MQENESAWLTEDGLKKYLAEGEGGDILYGISYNLEDDFMREAGERLASAIYAWMEAGCPVAKGDQA